MGITQQDVFHSLRTVLKSTRMQTLLLGGIGFEGSTPGLRWEYFRRLEQGATIEALPVVKASPSIWASWSRPCACATTCAWVPMSIRSSCAARRWAEAASLAARP